MLGADHFFSKCASARAMRNRLWFFRIIPWNRPDDPRYSFCLCPRLYVGCICPFFQTAIFLVVFFRPESRYFFSVESTPENSRRHLVAELLITASLHVTRPTYVSPSLFLSLFFPLRGLEFRGMYIRTAVAIVAFRALDCSTRTNETRPFAWCRLANGVATRRVALRRWNGACRITSTWKRCVAPHTLEASCATVWNYFCQTENSRPGDRIEFNSGSCAG